MQVLAVSEYCTIALSNITVKTAKLKKEGVRMRLVICSPYTGKRLQSIFITDRRVETYNALFDGRLSRDVVSRAAKVTVKKMANSRMEIQLREPQLTGKRVPAELKEYTPRDKKSCLNVPNHIWQFPEMQDGLPDIGIQIA